MSVLDALLKSVSCYATRAQVRAAPVPASGQTIVAVTESPAGIWAWTPGDSTADDGSTSLAPSSTVDANRGRWKILPLSLSASATGGDLTGALSSASVVGLRGRSLGDVAPTEGQLLAWNAGLSQWRPSALSVAWSNISGTPTTLAGYGITDAVNVSSIPVASNLLTGGVPVVGAAGAVLVSTGTAPEWRSSTALLVEGTGAPTDILPPGSIYQRTNPTTTYDCAYVANTAGDWLGVIAAPAGTVIPSSTGLTLAYGGANRLVVDGTRANFTYGGSTGNVIIREQVGTIAKGALYLGVASGSESSANYTLSSDNTSLTHLNVGAAGTIGMQFGASTYTSLTTTTCSFVQTTMSMTGGSSTYKVGDSTSTRHLTIQAGNNTAGGSTGGDLILTSGTGTATHGSTYLQVGGTSRVSVSAAKTVMAHSSGYVTATTQIGGAATNSAIYMSVAPGAETGSNYAVVSDASANNLYFNVAASVNFCRGGTVHWSVGGAATPVLSASGSQGNALIRADNRTVTETLTIQAPNNTASTSTGGDLILTSGTGTSTHGSTRLQYGGNNAATIGASGVSIVRATGQAPVAAAPATTTATHYVSGGEATCPAPVGQEVVSTNRGDTWTISQRNDGIANAGTYTVALGTASPLGGVHGLLTFEVVIVRAALGNASGNYYVTGATISKHLIAASWDGTGNAYATVTTTTADASISLAVTVGGATSGGIAANGAIVLTVTNSSGQSMFFRTLVFGGAPW